MKARDLLAEALAGVAARPSRLVLTTLGTVLGIAALVATLGIGQTAAGQIAERFDAVAATSVTLEPAQGEGPDGAADLMRLPWNSAERIERLNGVRAAGVVAEVDVDGAKVSGVPVADPSGELAQDIPVAAASAGLFGAVHARLSGGRYFDRGHDRRGDPVVLLGRYAAERLGITRVDNLPSIFIGERAYTVIGILDGVERRAGLLDSVVMPIGTARAFYALSSPDAVEISTRIGAPQLVGKQAPLAVSPNNVRLVDADVPPPPGSTKRDVGADVNLVFVALGGLALLVGGLGIANVTLLSVLERRSEIGLRRAVGAARRHIAAQFVIESTVIGFLGGLIGAAAGVLATVAVSAVRDWTPLLDVQLALGAPLLGAAIGLLAGLYPALRAAAVEPIAALRAG